jgi:hypothetical protein
VSLEDAARRLYDELVLPDDLAVQPGAEGVTRGLPGVAMPVFEDGLEEAVVQGAREARETRFAPEDCGCEVCRHHRRIYGLIARNEIRQARKLRRR